MFHFLGHFVRVGVIFPDNVYARGAFGDSVGSFERGLRHGRMTFCHACGINVGVVCLMTVLKSFCYMYFNVRHCFSSRFFSLCTTCVSIADAGTYAYGSGVSIGESYLNICSESIRVPYLRIRRNFVIGLSPPR